LHHKNPLRIMLPVLNDQKHIYHVVYTSVKGI
jgi:hypothetical protein